jgi:hypothetical protein
MVSTDRPEAAVMVEAAAEVPVQEHPTQAIPFKEALEELAVVVAEVVSTNQAQHQPEEATPLVAEAAGAVVLLTVPQH